MQQKNMKILESASKLVLLFMTLSIIVLTFLKIIDPKDFTVIAVMVFTFYFTNKGDQKLPFGGK